MGIQLNLEHADSILSQNSKRSAQYKAANQAMRAMDRFVPKSDMQKQNRLRTEVNVGSNGASIVYFEPYAREQFYGMINGSPVRNYTTPGTSRRWDKRLIGDDKAMQTVTDAYRRELLQ